MLSEKSGRLLLLQEGAPLRPEGMVAHGFIPVFLTSWRHDGKTLVCVRVCVRASGTAQCRDVDPQILE